MRYLPLTPDDRSAMLGVIGASSVDALFADVPEGVLLTGPIAGLPSHASEMVVERHNGGDAAVVQLVAHAAVCALPKVVLVHLHKVHAANAVGARTVVQERAVLGAVLTPRRRDAHQHLVVLTHVLAGRERCHALHLGRSLLGLVRPVD